MLSLLLALLQTTDPGRAAFESACVDCHSGRRARAGFDVQVLLDLKHAPEGLFDWRRAGAMIETSAMPPDEDLPVGTRETLLVFLEKVENQALETGGAAGQEPVRRLTRTELGNALERLLKVEVDEASILPDERIAEGGFEANAATLFVHAEWLERAGALVRRALELALPAQPDAPATLDLTALEPGRFLRGVYRRPATEVEIAPLRSALAAGSPDKRRVLVRAALERALASPHFLLRLEDAVVAPSEQLERPVGAFGLASRLAFLLTAGPPDEALLELAAKDKLNGAALEAEIDRLLSGPHGLDFARSFAEQWLGTHVLGTRVKPDPIDVPFMTDSLMAAMREELVRFVHWLFVEERPLEDLLISDVSFLDAELGRFYDQRVSGDFQRVALEDKERHGLLGKAAVMAVTAYPDRTSPVLRGVWVLDDLLGTPPPPPPPGASELDEDLEDQLFEDGPRGVLEAHRASKACMSCHEQIDPLGFGLEGFDQFGRRRRGVDTRGELPSGQVFKGAHGLSQVLLKERRSDLAKQVARRLLALSLARPLEWYDERTLVELAGVLEREGFRALLLATVESRPFRFQTLDAEPAGAQPQ